MLKRLSLTAAALGVTALPAFAHLNPEEHGSFMAGVSHPFFGADHILAMVAVGIWASQIAVAQGDRKALWIVPSAFVGTMAQLLVALENREEPEISGQDNLKTMALVDACYLSAREHRAVAIKEVLNSKR